tara:strand:+ start:185 stop:586 length:402 start_codon:yes stop_codon:yes gene_type:complete
MSQVATKQAQAHTHTQIHTHTHAPLSVPTLLVFPKTAFLTWVDEEAAAAVAAAAVAAVAVAVGIGAPILDSGAATGGRRQVHVRKVVEAVQHSCKPRVSPKTKNTPLSNSRTKCTPTMLGKSLALGPSMGRWP